ncbi:unnamed protein product [Rodentolepis nana]|uniref:Uncharacterized protein n=1 Tax=Rodentolepis nana TaxID=102285 RepID=A0A0R3TYB6_RODNA|nr:unnamed protein product [Rodentolepis nana]
MAILFYDEFTIFLYTRHKLITNDFEYMFDLGNIHRSFSNWSTALDSAPIKSDELRSCADSNSHDLITINTRILIQPSE